jgi:hypothetical protein
VRRPGLAAGGCWLRRLLGTGVGVGCFAGFQGHGIGCEGAGRQGCGEAGDEVFVGQMAAEQEDLDQGPGAVAFTVGFDGGFPPGVVHGGEPAGGPGPVEDGGTGQGAGLADQRFQVVVEFEARSIAGDEPLVPGDFLAAVVDHDSPMVRGRVRMRRASSSWSYRSIIVLSSASVSTSGTGTRWLRRNEPVWPSTPPFSWALRYSLETSWSSRWGPTG